MQRPGSRKGLLAVLGVVLALSATLRFGTSTSVPYPPGGNAPDGWFVVDPDSMYHFRRVERLFEEGLPVAGTDAFLDYPRGARIPWPPYYDLALYACMAPVAPEQAAPRRRFIEETAATLPVFFGVAASLMAGAAGWYLGGNAGGLLAGGYHALFMAAINYSNLGNGDHHAWVSMLLTAMLLLLTGALARGGLDRWRKGLAWGAAAGLVAGVLMGSWVASLMYVLQVQVVLGWLILLHSRRPMAGLPAFGLAFHLAAAAVLLPAVIASPWLRPFQDEPAFPWMVVNLSWFHPAQLLTGAAVFVPLLLLRERSRALRLYPLLVAGGLGLLGAVLALTDAGPARGIREGFDWVSRGNEFMAGINESLPLVGRRAQGFYVFHWLGYGLILLPFAWLAAAKQAFFNRRVVLLPWVLGIPLLLVQAFQQRRFGEALAVPMSVMVGWAVAAAYRAQRPAWWSRLAGVVRGWPAAGRLALGLVLVGAAHWHMINVFGLKMVAERNVNQDNSVVASRGFRMLLHWLGRNSPDDGDYGVLASWDDGHAIEWVSGRPTVATNFGNYVGDGYYAPPSFFMEEDPEAAEGILRRRKVRYLVISHLQDRRVPSFIQIACPQKFSRYARRDGPDAVAFLEPWFRTMGHKLVRDGYSRGPKGRNVSGPLRFLRLIYVSPYQVLIPQMMGVDNRLPAGWIWEYVPGAVVEAKGRPGEELRVQFQIKFRRATHTVDYSDKAVAGPDGVARLRVPYCTTKPVGDGEPAGRALWRFAGRQGRLIIPEAAVREGRTIRIQ